MTFDGSFTEGDADEGEPSTEDELCAPYEGQPWGQDCFEGAWSGSDLEQEWQAGDDAQPGEEDLERVGDDRPREACDDPSGEPVPHVYASGSAAEFLLPIWPATMTLRTAMRTA